MVTSKTLFDGPPIPKSRMTAIGGAGVAVWRHESQQDKGPVLVHLVSEECTEVYNNVRTGDRLVSVNTESIDHLPMRVIWALIDGQDGTRLTLQFETVNSDRKIPDRVAFWKDSDRHESFVTKASFELKRSNQLPLSKANDEDDWMYKKANPTNAEMQPREGPKAIDGPDSNNPLATWGLFSKGAPHENKEPIIGILHVMVSRAKKLAGCGANRSC